MIKNTFILSGYAVLASFPLPIMLALMLNEVRHRFFRKTVQLVTYAPYFISTVVIVSMIILMLAPRLGIVNKTFGLFGIAAPDLLGNPDYFRHIYVWSDVWQTTGYAAVIYLAALSAVDPGLYESAKVDGASRIRRIWHVDIPGIMPVAMIILILSVGNIMAIGFEKVYLLQNPLNLGTVGDHRHLRLQDWSAERRLQPGDRDRAVQLGDQRDPAGAGQCRRQAAEWKRAVVTLLRTTRDTNDDAVPSAAAGRPRRIKETPIDRVFLIAVYILLAVALIIVVVPLLYIVSSSLSSPAAVSSGQVYLWPVDFSTAGYTGAVGQSADHQRVYQLADLRDRRHADQHHLDHHDRLPAVA